MAYNTRETQIAVNMAEQALWQRQIPFDIIFDQQINNLEKYQVIVLADQESLSDEVMAALKGFAKKGGGLVLTDNTGMYDGWRRIRKQNMLEEMMIEQGLAKPQKTEILRRVEGIINVSSFYYGAGRVIYLPELKKPQGEIRLGYLSSWVMPLNADELESAVNWASGRRLPLKVIAPEWIGVSHDTQKNRDIIHLFTYNTTIDVDGITLEYDGAVKSAWTISPDENKKMNIPVVEKGGINEIKIPGFQYYKIVVLEK